MNKRTIFFMFLTLLTLGTQPYAQAMFSGRLCRPGNIAYRGAVGHHRLYASAPGHTKRMKPSFIGRCIRMLFGNKSEILPNDAGVIILPLDSKDSLPIYTQGLCGCIATVLYIKDIEGNKRALMTHYAPRYIEQHLAELDFRIDELLAQTSLENVKSIKFVLLMCTSNYMTDQATHAARCDEISHSLTNLVAEKFHPLNVKTNLIWYDRAPDIGITETATFWTILSHDQSCHCQVQEPFLNTPSRYDLDE